MATASSNEILHDFPPLIRVFKDGRLERLSGTAVDPATVDQETGVECKDVKISPESNVSARLYIPKTAKPGEKLPLLVYFHGGGFVTESAFSPLYQKHLNSLSSDAKIIIVSVDYRLVPEYPLPIAYEDSWLALNWINSHSKSQGQDEWLNQYADFNRVYFSGDSAGGNIAHQMAIKIGLEKLQGLNLVGIILNCPYFWGKDPIGNESSKPEIQKFMNAFWNFVYPNSKGLDDPYLNPEMDPNLGKLGCKKVLIYVAGNDPIKDRGWNYREALMKTPWEGVAEVVEFGGEEHVFNLIFPTGENALSMIKKWVAFINQVDL